MRGGAGACAREDQPANSVCAGEGGRPHDMQHAGYSRWVADTTKLMGSAGVARACV